MPTFNDRLRFQQKRLSDKEKQLERLTKSIETARENIKTVNREISEIKAEIGTLETRILTDAISQKGISIADLAAAIEAGALSGLISEKPPDKPDKSEKSDDSDCATYSTTENLTLPEKEGLDDISDSGETVGSP